MSWTKGRPPTTRASRAQRDRILERDPVCCCDGCTECPPAGCSRPSTRADHIVPWSQGGDDGDGNLRGMCEPCHDVKTAAEQAAGRAKHSRRRPPAIHPSDA